MDFETILKTTRRYEQTMCTYFENTICKKTLYSGKAYTFVARVSCQDSTIEYAVYNPLKGVKCFSDFEIAKDYFLSLGN